jgi:hypothetical protein
MRQLSEMPHRHNNNNDGDDDNSDSDDNNGDSDNGSNDVASRRRFKVLRELTSVDENMLEHAGTCWNMLESTWR